MPVRPFVKLSDREVEEFVNKRLHETRELLERANIDADSPEGPRRITKAEGQALTDAWHAVTDAILTIQHRDTPDKDWRKSR